MAYYTQEQGLISQRRGSSSYFYHYDGLGSTKALTDVNQNTQASYIYDAWGNILQTSGTVTNPYIFIGKWGYYMDIDLGLYLLHSVYSPEIGRSCGTLCPLSFNNPTSEATTWEIKALSKNARSPGLGDKIGETIKCIGKWCERHIGVDINPIAGGYSKGRSNGRCTLDVL